MAAVTVIRLGHCILTHNRYAQTRWFMIGSADYEVFECATSCAHFCVHFSFGCRVHSLFCPSYIDTTSLYLVMYDVRFLVSLSCLMILLIISTCSCAHCGRLLCEVPKMFLSLETSPVPSSFQVPSCRSMFSHKPLHQRRNKNGYLIGKRIFFSLLVSAHHHWCRS